MLLDHASKLSTISILRNMDGRSPPALFLFFFSLVALGILELTGISYATSTAVIRCHASERKALQEFKRGLLDPSHRLSSWVGEDCCAWQGVGCSNITGHVFKLDLQNRDKRYLYQDCADTYMWPDDDSGCKWTLRGEISESLLSLRHLRHLDLSANFFQRKPIPQFLGSLRTLTYLDLSGAGFSGRVPDQLGNLSQLHHLDLSYNGYHDYDVTLSGILYLEDAGWISRLISLRYLTMTWVSFANASDWLEALNTLPRILYVELRDCELVYFPGFLPHVNFTSLITLDLSYNKKLNSSVVEWLFNITTLEHFHLGGTHQFNGLSVPIPPLWKLRSLRLSYVPLNDELINLIFSNSYLMFSLEELDFSFAHLSGSLPDWLGSMKNLKYLYLSGNSLYGSLPTSLGCLSLLQYLDVSDNGLNGTIPKGMFKYMKELKYFDISYNSLILSEEHLTNLLSLKDLIISQNTVVLNESFEDWIPPFQLYTLFMGSCKIQPKLQIPKWIRTQKALLELDISSAGIQGKIPNWLPTTLRYLNLSNNQITGPLPYYLHNIIWLELWNNSFSGQLSSAVHKLMPNIAKLYLSMNELSGSISSSFCQLKFLAIFKISKNQLWGSKLPDCWKNSSYLSTIDFSNNKLQGEIPRSLCNLRELYILHLSNNDLWGQIPSCLKYCTKLSTLDLSHNRLIGNIPTWIGESSPQLQILDLRSNAFTGSIPQQLFTLMYLQILDLSNNNLSGIIPSTFGNYTTLKGDVSYHYMAYLQLFMEGEESENNMWLFIKGREFDVKSGLFELVRLIDLSNNRLIGHIPKEFGDLHALHTLNLSQNYLMGEIPSSIEGLQNLEVLDLSRNNL